MNLHILQKLGVYIDQEFLSKDECEEIRQAIRGGEQVAANVYSKRDQSRKIDPEKRQSLFANVPATLAAKTDRKIEALRPRLEEKFNERFAAQMEAAKFLLYREGHFFAPHTDDQLGRRVNLSIYLNDQTDHGGDGTYSGGELKLYGLVDRPEWNNRGMSLRGQGGMLVAYRADLVHEVTPVLCGERYAIVARFLQHQGNS